MSKSAYEKDWKRMFLKALKEDPDFALEVRKLLLSEELINLPSKLDELIAVIKNQTEKVENLTKKMESITDNIRELFSKYDELVSIVKGLMERVDNLTERIDKLTERVDKLTEYVRELFSRYEEISNTLRSLIEKVDSLTKRVDELTARVDSLVNRVDELTKRVDKLTERMDAIWNKYEKEFGELKSYVREVWVAQRAHAIFGKLIIKGREFRESPEILLDALKSGKITETERDRVLDTDLLWKGEYEGVSVFFAVEVSYTIGEIDVLRAKESARILRKLGFLSVPVVAGVNASVHDDEVVFILDGLVEREKFEKIFNEFKQFSTAI